MRTLIVIAVVVFVIFIFAAYYLRKQNKRDKQNKEEIKDPKVPPAKKPLTTFKPTTVPRSAKKPLTTFQPTTQGTDPSTDWIKVTDIISTSTSSLNNLKVMVATEKVLIEKSEFWGYKQRKGHMTEYQRLIYEVAYSITRTGIEERQSSATSQEMSANLAIQKASLQTNNLYLKETDVEKIFFKFGVVLK